MQMLKKTLLAAGLLAVSISLLAWGQSATTQRSPEAIGADLQTATGQLQQAILTGEPFQSADARKKAAPQMLPIVHHILSLIDELAVAQPGAKAELDATKMQFYVLAAILDDPTQIAALKTTAGGTDLDAARAKAELAVADFVKAADDAGRNKALDEFDAAVLGAPGDDPTLSMIQMTSIDTEPSLGIYQHLLKIVKDDSQAPSADQLNTLYAGEIQQLEMVGKPLTIQGTTLGGRDFSTTQWNGKVILVDFWATWCGPCIAEMPLVKKAYADYHDKGLEVLGVSNDNSGDDLRKFLAQNPDMPWTQLFDEKATGWNPITLSYGIQQIPTMYLIDKKGILRSVEARGQLERLLPQLLAEK
jgi:thiol-disulfide isomerase/thioredoxin